MRCVRSLLFILCSTLGVLGFAGSASAQLELRISGSVDWFYDANADGQIDDGLDEQSFGGFLTDGEVLEIPFSGVDNGLTFNSRIDISGDLDELDDPGTEAIRVTGNVTQIFEDFETQANGFGNTFGSVGFEFDTNLISLSGGFAEDTIDVVFDVSFDGSFRSTRATGDPATRGSFGVVAGAPGVSSPVATSFSFGGFLGGSPEFRDNLTVATTTDGAGNTTVAFSAPPGGFDFSVPLSLDVDAGEAEVRRALTLALQWDLGFVNSTGGAFTYNDESEIDLGTQTLAIRSIRVLTDDVALTFVPEPSPILGMMMGLLGLGHFSRQRARPSSRSGR